ncbi:unnamed protein product [Paramecium sonneborni]|uniref:Uncharacterized protein n=1 Tax=Paramecium sonneborni TaxID=65129 RepID=A0A8S1RNT0_9CILI|nr:unnamed protein product [Paramecium sonneborni]
MFLILLILQKLTQILEWIIIQGVLQKLKQRGLKQLRKITTILVEKLLQYQEQQISIHYQNLMKFIVQFKMKIMNHNMNLKIFKVKYQLQEIVVYIQEILENLKQGEILQRNVNKNPYLQLINCLIFPATGNSLPCQIARGYLDIDYYLKPIVYDEKKVNSVQPKKIDFKENNKIDMVKLFILLKLENKSFQILNPFLNFFLIIWRKNNLQPNNYWKIIQVNCIFRRQIRQYFIFRFQLTQLTSYQLQIIVYFDKIIKQNIKIAINLEEIKEQKYKIKEQQQEMKDWKQKLKKKNKKQKNYNKQLKNNNKKLKKNNQTKKQFGLIKNYINDNYKRHFESSIKLILHIFETVFGITQIFVVKKEILAVQKGDGLYQKKKLNVQKYQKRIIALIIQLHQELERKLQTLSDIEKMQRISLINFILQLQTKTKRQKQINLIKKQIIIFIITTTYSLNSHPYPTYTILGEFIEQLINQISSFDDSKILMRTHTIWYRDLDNIYFERIQQRYLGMIQKNLFDQVYQKFII